MSQVENEVVEMEVEMPSPEENEAATREWLYGNSNAEIVADPVEPTEEVQVEDDNNQEIANLLTSLSSSNSPIGDWKVAKCYEYQLVGLEPPYDIAELHVKRQAVRDRINELQ